MKAICTIVAKNYVAFARTLCESFSALHEDAQCFVLVVDDWEGYLDPEQERFALVKIEDVKIPNIQLMRFRYNITEYSTAVKPFLMKYLIENYALDKLVYFDPDILILNRVDALYDLLETADILVTPHLDADYPDDEHKPDDGQIMMSGIFNLGFIAVRNTANVISFLSWWQKKLAVKCYNDPPSGYFVDQRFVDYALVLFDKFHIIKNTGYNVAYWNIHSRSVHKTEQGWRCNDGPLYFYHFSNYKAERPDELSGYQTRFDLRDFPELLELFRHYAALIRKNGYEETYQWPYTFRTFSDGTVITDFTRKLHRMKYITVAPDAPFEIALLPAYQRTLARFFSASTRARKMWFLLFLMYAPHVFRMIERIIRILKRMFGR